VATCGDGFTWKGVQIGVGVGGPDVHPARGIPGYDHWPSVAGKVPIAGAVQYAA